MEKLIVCLSNSGHYSDEYREVTKEELKKLEYLESKYGYLDAVPKKEYVFVKKILNRKEIDIKLVTLYQ